MACLSTKQVATKFTELSNKPDTDNQDSKDKRLVLKYLGVSPVLILNHSFMITKYLLSHD